MNSPEIRSYRFADFEIDANRRQLLRNGEAVAIKAKAFDLLLALVERRGDIVSKNELLETVWAGQYVEEGNLTVHISALRRILGETKKDNRFIATVPGRGYSFVADLQNGRGDEVVVQSRSLSQITVEDQSLEADKASNPSSSTAARLVRPRDLLQSRFVFVCLLIAVAIALGLTAYFWLKRPLDRESLLAFDQMSLKRLTNIGNVGYSAISPDGKLYTYSRFIGDQDSLWLGRVDGGEPVQILPPADRSIWNVLFSRDGDSIFYVANDSPHPGALYKVPVFGGVPEKLYEPVRSIDLSPNGEQIVFLRPELGSGKLSVIIADINGENEHEIASVPGDIDSNRNRPAWSPDGRTIMISVPYNYDDSKLFAIDVADGSVTQISDRRWSVLDGLAWLKDGSGLVAVGSDIDTFSLQLWLISYPTGDVRRLSNDLSSYSGSNSLSNNNTLLTLNGTSQSNIFVAPVSNLRNARQITFGGNGNIAGWFGLVWTPDGRIVYSVRANGGLTLLIMDADGQNAKQLVPDGGDNTYPSISADGQTLVFQSNRSGHFNVWRVGLDGSDLTQLTTVDMAGQPFISRDGQWVVYTSQVNTRGMLWRIPASGGEPQLLSNKYAGWPQISNDSKLVACEIEIDGQRKLGVLSLATGSMVKLFELPRLANLRLGVHWAPDDKALTYRDWSNGIWNQRLDGGEPTRISGLPEEKLYCYGWSPDGRNFAFTRGSTSGDLVLISDR